MRTRVVLALLVVALTVAGCGSSIAPVSVSVSPVEPSPSGASEVTAAPPPAGATDVSPAGSAEIGRAHV